MEQKKIFPFLKNTVLILLVLTVFLLALDLMGGAFKLFGKETAESIISLTSNPFISLFVGLFATAMIQSSSTTTSMIVAIVAAGGVSIESAIPMIMGANIGTSVTSSIVALGHINKRDEYRKAISAATVHDFFNIIVVIILFPLELYTNFLSTTGHMLAGFFYSNAEAAGKGFSLIGSTIKPLGKLIIGLLNKNIWMTLGLSFVLLVLSLRWFTKLLKGILIGNSQKAMEKYIFGKPITSLFWGTVLTAGVQSSSVTTSLAVPLVAADKASIKQIFPFLMGANIGTTVTAMMAAISQSEAALTVAFCHLLFNVFGVVILFPFEKIRNIPIMLSEALGTLSFKVRWAGLAYIVVVFFLIPFNLIYFTSDNTQKEAFKAKEVKEASINTPSKTVNIHVATPIVK